MDWNGNFHFFFWPIFGVFFLVALAILAFDVWMLVDAIQRPPEQFSTPDAKTWWIVGLIVGLVTGLPAIAVAIAYYVIVKRPARARSLAVPTPPAEAAVPPPGIVPSPPANCSNCGARLPAGARFCHSCGTPVA